jgi:glycosyltransferase involved in cell wall biosynthesis
MAFRPVSIREQCLPHAVEVPSIAPVATLAEPRLVRRERPGVPSGVDRHGPKRSRALEVPMPVTPDRIVVLNDSSTVRGGATFLALTLARHLAAAGSSVTFVAGDKGGADVPPDVDLVALGGERLLEAGARKALLTGLYNRAAARAVSAWIAVNDTPHTVYHLHNWALILSPAIFDALAPVAARCVIHCHDFFLACPNGVFFDYPRLRTCSLAPLSANCVARQCDKRSYPQKLWRVARQGILARRLAPFLDASSFVVNNDAMVELLARAIRPRDIRAIRNPVEPFGPMVRAPERQHRLFYIGQIQRYKGVFEVAEAGRRIGRRVDFFGEGDARPELMRAYPEHAYHGWTARTAIAAELASARVSIVATQGPDTFCLAAFESLATGLPLVASDSLLATEALDASGGTLSFAAASVDALTEVLTRVAADDDLVARLASAARAQGPKLAQSVDQWVSANEAVYAGLLSGARPIAA